ncbi:hypothetical protein D3C86_1978730 [compost metagenome]
MLGDVFHFQVSKLVPDDFRRLSGCYGPVFGVEVHEYLDLVADLHFVRNILVGKQHFFTFHIAQEHPYAGNPLDGQVIVFSDK